MNSVDAPEISENLVRHTLWYALALGAPAAIQIASVAILTRLMGPDEYGIVVFVMALVLFANATVFRWQRMSLVRYLPRAGTERVEILRAVIATTGLAALAIVAGSLLFALAFPSTLRLDALLLVGLLTLVTQAAFDLVLEVFRADGRSLRYGTYSALRALLSLLIGVGLVYAGLGPVGVLAGMTIGLFAGAVLGAGSLPSGSLGVTKARRETVRRIATYGVPLAAAGALTFVVGTSDRLLLGILSTPKEVGIFGGAYDISKNALLMLMMTVNQAAFPLAIRAYERGDQAAFRKRLEENVTLLLLLSIPATVGLAVMARPMADVFLGPDYREAATQVIPWLVAGAWFAGFRAFYLDISFQLSENTRMQIWVMLAAALLNVVLNLILIPPLGAIGAAYASAAAYVAAFGVSLALSRKALPLPMPLGTLARVGMASLVMAAAMLAARAWWGADGLIVQLAIGLGVYLSTMVLIAPKLLRAALRLGPRAS